MPKGPPVEDVDEGNVGPVDHSVSASGTASQYSASSGESHTDSSLPTIHGMPKGFRFFKDGCVS